MGNAKFPQTMEVRMSDTSGSGAVRKTLDDLKAAGDAARQVSQQAKQAGSDAIGPWTSPRTQRPKADEPIPQILSL